MNGLGNWCNTCQVMLSVNVHEFSKVKPTVLYQIPQVLEEGRNKNNLLNWLVKLHFHWAIFIFLVLCKCVVSG